MAIIISFHWQTSEQSTLENENKQLLEIEQTWFIVGTII